MMKRIAIIGRGTAGAFAFTHYLRFTDFEIHWYYDSKVKPQAVGEGTTLIFPPAIANNIDFGIMDLESIYGTVKCGIKKTNWGETGRDYIHEFSAGDHGYHFNAVMLQNYIFEYAKKQKRVTLIDKNVEHHEVDADFIMDCSGKPRNYDDYHYSEFIPVNTAYVTQCYWEGARFQYTLTLARPYGWVFGIPLLNRCAIGYMYNSTINSLDEVKEDVQHIFKEYNLTPSTDTNFLEFKNYYRKENFVDRVCYNGNASFFLEPLEATSINMMHFIQREFFDLIASKIFNDTSDESSIECKNESYLRYIREIENVIMLHYAAGSKFNTDFWKFAKERGKENFSLLKSNPRFSELMTESKKIEDYGTWPKRSFLINLQNLNLIREFIA